MDNEGNSLLHVAALSMKKFGPPKIEQFQSWKDRLLQNAKRVFDEILDKQAFKINSKPIQIPEEVVELYFQDPSVAIFRNLLLQAKVNPFIKNQQNKTVLDLLNESQKELPTVKQYMEEETSEKKSKRRMIGQLSQAMLSKILEYL